MPEQERRSTRPDGSAEEAGAAPAATGKKLKDAMDHLVDEIDDVLETNAEEFVKSYVQRGGE